MAQATVKLSLCDCLCLPSLSYKSSTPIFVLDLCVYAHVHLRIFFGATSDYASEQRTFTHRVEIEDQGQLMRLGDT